MTDRELLELIATQVGVLTNNLDDKLDDSEANNWGDIARLKARKNHKVR